MRERHLRSRLSESAGAMLLIAYGKKAWLVVSAVYITFKVFNNIPLLIHDVLNYVTYGY